MVSSLQLAVMATAVAVVTTSCPSSDWLELDGRCYWWSTSAINWGQVSAACRSVHPEAGPVSVHSQTLNALLSQTLLHGFPTWMGLHRADSGGAFTWQDDSPLDFQFWADGEPSGDGELCAYINSDPITGVWAACDCDQWSFPYMCQL